MLGKYKSVLRHCYNSSARGRQTRKFHKTHYGDAKTLGWLGRRFF